MALAALLAAACAAGDWRHNHKGLAELALDEAECRALAENEAYAASLGKTRMVREAYLKGFARCMAERGWRRGRDNEVQAPPETMAGPDSVSGFSMVFRLPPGFSPAGEDQGATGPSTWTRHAFADPAGQSLMLVFQESPDSIGEAEFPVPRDYSVYDRGSAGGLRWIAFFDRRAGTPVICLGSYVPAGKGRRIIVTAVSILPRDGGPPPSLNLDLNDAQRTGAEAFIKRWTEWLSENPLSVGE